MKTEELLLDLKTLKACIIEKKKKTNNLPENIPFLH